MKKRHRKSFDDALNIFVSIPLLSSRLTMLNPSRRLYCLNCSPTIPFFPALSIMLSEYNDVFFAPHSRYTTVNKEDILRRKELEILSTSEEAGVYAVSSLDGKQIFIMGHSEYDPQTLNNEYIRDKKAGLKTEVPANYFPSDDDTKEPLVRWRAHGNLLYSNWLNYYVYQTTPYDIMRINHNAVFSRDRGI